MQPLVEAYLAGSVPLQEFKSTIDGINKRNALWGIKGQMFFNLLVNHCSDQDECDQNIKSAICCPYQPVVKPFGEVDRLDYWAIG